jgi:hypothetical protein
MALHLTTQIAHMPHSSSADHPTDEAVAAYLEAALSPGERAQVEAHLGDCEYCRSRLVLASQVLETAPPSRTQRRVFPLAAGLLAAAGLAGVLLLSRSAVEQPSSSPVRAAEEMSLPPVRTLGPTRGTAVDAGRLRFVWRSISSDVLYQVTLSAADGQVLWTGRTSDTVATPPPATLQQLESGQSYFWRVDALLANLQSVTSGDQRFEVSPR